ncbi:Fe-S oxidoreductase [Candidatus Magnetomorum sp. HK-1]|nr:Fe-S oxidoreductase [Candidatus Magnetomorum sp. HK-1]
MTIFQCQKCGDCCKGYGGTYVTKLDIQKISNFIHLTSEQFIEKYCVLSGKKYLLAQSTDTDYCIFWDHDKLCTIHPVKPRMCRNWPYIHSVLLDPGNWAMMGSCCPGIDTNASSDIIIKTIKKEMVDHT